MQSKPFLFSFLITSTKVANIGIVYVRILVLCSMRRSSALGFIQCVHVQLHFLTQCFSLCCEERSSSHMFKREFPGVNPICLSLLFLPFTAMTVIMLSIIWRGEGVIYPSPSDDFIKKLKSHSTEWGKRTIGRKGVFIAFTNCTVLVGQLILNDSCWQWQAINSSQSCKDLPASHQSHYCKFFLYVKHLSMFWPQKPYRF